MAFILTGFSVTAAAPPPLVLLLPDQASAAWTSAASCAAVACETPLAASLATPHFAPPPPPARLTPLALVVVLHCSVCVCVEARWALASTALAGRERAMVVDALPRSS